jgi:uncharacterized cupin superfamily protein
VDRAAAFEAKERGRGAARKGSRWGAILASVLRNQDLVVQTDRVDRADLPVVPIPPDWVIEGNPRAGVKLLTQAGDGGLDAVVWECTAGKFHWYFAGDEFVHILEGEVAISDEHGQGTRVLKAGDVAFFPSGLRSIWQVDTYVKKLALRRDNEVGLLFRARRKLGKLLGAR